MRKVRFIVLLVSLLVTLMMLSACGGARPRPTDEIPGTSVQPTFVMDYAAFRSEIPDTNVLELYFQIFNYGLQFSREGKNWLADYVLQVKVFNGDGEQVQAIEQPRLVRVIDEQKLESRHDFRTSQVNLRLPPGKYDIQARLQDRRSSSFFTRNADVKLPNYNTSDPTLSQIEFVEAVQDHPDTTATVFSKGQFTIIPSVSRAFGGTDSARLIYYVEIYSGATETDTNKVVVETIVRSLTKGMLYRDTLHLTLATAAEKQLRTIDISTLPPGDYDLEIMLRGWRNKKLDERVEPFLIAWTQEGLLRHDFETAVQQLSYIASKAAVDSIKKMETLEERIAAFNQFWADRDPTFGTPENESKQEFYRRINYANRQYRHMGSPGWRTDRGHIYIVYGDPDQIDDHPMSPESVPYQIWHYYREGRYKRFTFVDKNSDGDYRLQFPYDGLNQRPDF